MTNFELHATNLVDVVYGNERLRYDDPSENWFEASKIYRPSMAWDAPGVAPLLRSPVLQRIATRAGKRYTHLPFVALPEPRATSVTLEDAIERRFSADEYDPGAVPLDVVASLLLKSYGAVRRADGWRRPVPSGGALYPLDVYLIARNVEGIESGVHHFDAFEKGLVRLGDVDYDAFMAALLREEELSGTAFSIVLSCSFWRSRFKYGPRAYRFALIEAGHVMQNMVLLATAHGLTSRPYGGFIDDELTDVMIDQNGVDEAPLYVLTAGSALPG
jgi:SagB-type dehydrogenase family enzyme